MTDDELDAIAATPQRLRTHWHGCEADHPDCAVHRLVAEVRRLRADLAAAHESNARMLGEVVRLRAGLAAERERAVRLVARYLLYDSQRAVSWHEVQDVIAAIREGRPCPTTSTRTRGSTGTTGPAGPTPAATAG